MSAFEQVENLVHEYDDLPETDEGRRQEIIEEVNNIYLLSKSFINN
jgi:hypothetical protein